MSINSQQYANLTQHAYGEEIDGKKSQMQPLVGEKITLEGVTYKVSEHMDQPSGYQSAIHQHVDAGEIVVNHHHGSSPAAARSRNVQHRVAAFFGSAMRPAAAIKKIETRRHHLWLGLGVMLSLPACNLSTPSGGKPVADYKQNPNPQQRYDITLTIADAPGPFASMEGSAQYEVVNLECLPPPNSNPGGYISRMTRHVPFTLTPVSKTDYTGVVYADQLLDEGYHGRGVCHWQLTHVGVKLMATGAKGETKFLPSISAVPLSDEKTETTYYWKDRFPRSETDNYPDFGRNDRSEFRSELQQQLFSITITSRKGTP